MERWWPVRKTSDIVWPDQISWLPKTLIQELPNVTLTTNVTVNANFAVSDSYSFCQCCSQIYIFCQRISPANVFSCDWKTSNGIHFCCSVDSLRRRKGLFTNISVTANEIVQKNLMSEWEMTQWGKQCWNDPTYLNAGHLWRKHQTLIVTVHHHNHTNRPGGDGPWILVGVTSLPCLGILKWEVKHLWEVLTQMMRGGSLNPTTSGWDVGLYCGGEICPSECLLPCLATFHYRNSHVFLVDFFIQIDNLVHLVEIKEAKCKDVSPALVKLILLIFIMFLKQINHLWMIFLLHWHES